MILRSCNQHAKIFYQLANCCFFRCIFIIKNYMIICKDVFIKVTSFVIFSSLNIVTPFLTCYITNIMFLDWQSKLNSAFINRSIYSCKHVKNYIREVGQLIEIFALKYICFLLNINTNIQHKVILR